MRNWFHGVVSDTRFGLRLLLRSPGFTVVAVLTLALGIGANTAIFSVIHSVLLRPLPFVEPDRLFLAYQSMPEQGRETMPVSPPNFGDWREQSQLFDGLAAFYGGSFNLTGGEAPERVPGMHVSAGFFGLMIDLIGADRVYATPRGTFGFLELYDGVPLIPALVGLFAVSEAFAVIERQSILTERGQDLMRKAGWSEPWRASASRSPNGGISPGPA